MILNDKICGVVVWYNPTTENVAAINSYISEIKHLFVVDNSDLSNEILLEALPKDKITYVPLNENKGIATALNIGCVAAAEAGA